MKPALMNCLVFSLAVVCGAQVVQPVIRGNQGSGIIDWTKRIIITTGIGVPNPGLPASAQRTAALGAAQLAASRNARETIGSICFNMSSSVGDILAKDGKTASAIDALLRGCEDKCRVRDLNGGSFEAIIEVPLSGANGLSAVLLGSSAPAPAPAAGRAGHDRRITGLIVDGRALGVRPALSPRIIDEKGNVVYGRECSTSGWASRFGIAGYAKTVEEALRQFDRIGNEPYIVKAKKARGKNGTDVIISESDAAAVLGSDENLKALSECRVILVIG